jgi:hypothetical protein
MLILVKKRVGIKKRLGVEFWVFARNYTQSLLVWENLVELCGYGLGCMFRELLPIHLRIVNPVVATLPRLFFVREDPFIDHVVEGIDD